MISGWMLGVLCCHVLGLLCGGVVQGAVLQEGEQEVGDCLSNYTNTLLYNVGSHLVLRNVSLTPTGLALFCKTNITDLYGCIEPHLNTESGLTTSIIGTFQHLCHEEQQPEWLKYSTCVSDEEVGTCLRGLQPQDREAVVTLYGADIVPGNIADQCRLLKGYVGCVYRSSQNVSTHHFGCRDWESPDCPCGKAAADWHRNVTRQTWAPYRDTITQLLSKQWGPYSLLRNCDIFDDEPPAPPEVVEVLGCRRNHTDTAMYNVGLHLVLRNLSLTHTAVADLCTKNVPGLYKCIEPHATTLTESLTNTFEHLCDEKQQKEWVRHSRCVPTERVEKCVVALDDRSAWVTLYDVPTPAAGDTSVPDQCRYMKDYLRCVYDVTKEECGKAGADWHAAVIRKIWRPYKDIIACDVYGPTGGVAGLITGIVVGLLLIGVCGFLIWYRPKTSTKRTVRESTAL